MTIQKHDHATDAGSVALPAFCRLDDYGLIRITGEAAAPFLQGQATCDVLALTPGATGCGAFCSPKGRVIATFHLFADPEGFHLALAADLAEPVSQRLQRYILRSRVRVENLTPSGQLIGLNNPAARERWSDQRPSAPIWPLNDGTERAMSWLDQAMTLSPAGQEAWRLRDIESGWPLIRATTSEQHLPQMLNLDRLGGVSFEKGCYTGQEIVTRTQFLGDIKRRLFHLRAQGSERSPLPGDPIFTIEGRERGPVGEVVSSAHDTSGHAHVLAVLLRPPATDLDGYELISDPETGS